MRYSLRSLFYLLTLLCVVSFFVGAIVGNTPVQFVASGLTAIGTPYCYFYYRNTRGSSIGRLVRTAFFAFGWFWVANYFAVLAAACSTGPRQDLDVMGKNVVRGTSCFLFPVTMIVAILLLRTYFWAYHEIEYAREVNDG